MDQVIRRMLKTAAVVAVLVCWGMFATGCNTIGGVGEDVSAAGQTLADWASPDAAK